MKKIDKYFNAPEYTELLSEEIIELFRTKSNSENTYCEFDLLKGKMGNIKDNTWFNIDIHDKDLELYQFKKALFDADLGELTKGEELDLQADVEDLFEKIKDYIEENYKSELRDSIRKICMPDSDPNIMPMKVVVLRNLDISDIESIYSEEGPYVFSIFKDPNDPDYDPEVYKENIAERMSNILSYLLEQSKETGKTISVLFEDEKKKPKDLQHPSFDCINENSKIKKMDWDLNLSFFVDYTIKDPE